MKKQGQQLRALVGARVSHVSGLQKVSHIAQQETGLKWVAEHGHTVVGTIQDLGVSASVSPFERPDLGPWLADDKQHEWQVLVFSKLDRLFRSTRDCVKFAEWAEQHSKLLVFAEDGLTLNYRDDRDKSSIDGMMSELFVYLGSFFAELELNRFKTRALDGHRVLRQTDRWASGVAPLGFKVVDHPSGKGKGLATDTEGKNLLYGMAERLLAGWSFIRIAAWLNDSGAQTNMNRAMIAKGKEPLTKKDREHIANGEDAKARPWTVSTVIDALTSPRTQGLKMHKGQTVLDGDGEPIVLAPPTFEPDQWRQIQTAAALRQLSQRTPSKTSNPMLGVGFCGICGASLAQQISRRKTKAGVVVHRYYRCGRTPLNCKGVTVRADIGDELLEQTFLEQWGDTKVTRKVFVAGEDRSDELEQVNATIDRLRRESDAGLLTTSEDERIWMERLKAQTARRDELASIPYRAAAWVEEETDQTYREVWPDSDHRQLLIDKGIRFVLNSGFPLNWHLYVPEDGQVLPMQIGAG
jgi:DNA invertase Pin-like site-specific DNA recombinase